MANTVQVKRSGTANSTPSALEYGELALNYADSKVFWKNASNTISSFTFQSYVTSSSVSSFALTLLDDTDAATMRTTIGALASTTPVATDAFNLYNYNAISVFRGLRANGTSSSPTAISAADTAVVNITAQGYDGSAYRNIAQIQFVSSEAFSSTACGGHIRFNTVGTGTTTVSERVRIEAGGNVGIGTTGPTALLDVNANTMRLRSSRTPASATAAGNAGDICWDASYLYICTATNTWRRIAHASW